MTFISTIISITSLRFKQNDIEFEIETLLIVTNFIIHKNTRFSNLIKSFVLCQGNKHTNTQTDLNTHIILISQSHFASIHCMRQNITQQ